MESWFHRLGWSCCGRTKSVNAPEDYAASPDTPLPHEDLHSLPTLPHVLSPVEFPSELETPQLPARQESKSSRSTVTAVGSSPVDTASLLLSMH